MVVVRGGDASAKNATLKYSELTSVKSEEVGVETTEHDDVACAMCPKLSIKRNAKITFYFGPLMDT